MSPAGDGSGVLWKAHGRGKPVTLVVHGLGATEGEARIPASGLSGTRVVATLPGHGAAPDAVPEYWDYGRIAEDLLAVADEVAATRAVGVSLGAGALTRLASEHPDRFDRLGLLLPASLDDARAEQVLSVFHGLAGAVRGASSDAGARLRELITDGLPAGIEVGDYVESRAAALLRLGDALERMPGQNALADSAALASVTSRVLVIGGTADPMHPTEVAKAVATAFADARLEVFPSPAPMLTHRRELRNSLVDFLDG